MCQQEPIEVHGRRTEAGQALPRGRRARQHPERQEGSRVRSDGTGDGGGQERQYGNHVSAMSQLSIQARGEISEFHNVQIS